MNKIILVSEQHRQRAIAVINSLPLDPVKEIVIRDHKRDRSAAQNQFYWQILTIIAAELGQTKEELHDDMKRKYLVNIYTRDNDDYAEMIETVRAVHRQGMKDEALLLFDRIVKMTSTTDATVPQFTEYLESIIHFAASLAIRLPVLEES